MPDANLSGLDETGLDPADLAQLRSSFCFRQLGQASTAPGAAGYSMDLTSLSSQTYTSVDLQISPPQNLAGRLLSRLGLGGRQSLKIPPFRLITNRDLDAALQQRVFRSRQFADDLPREVAERLFSQIYDKFGEQGHKLKVVALFRNIPAECAGSISLERNLQQASFTPGQAARQGCSAGYYLVVLREESGKLRRVLLRLE